MKKKENSIKACPACGSPKLVWASGGTDSYLDAIGGTGLGIVRCLDCGREALPIVFASEGERLRFAQKRAGSGLRQHGEGKLIFAGVTPARAYSKFEFAFLALFFAALAAGTLIAGEILAAAALAACGIAFAWLFVRANPQNSRSTARAGAPSAPRTLRGNATKK